MGKSKVKVVVRARPTASYASQNFVFNEASDSIDMRQPKEPGQVADNQKDSWHFSVDKVMVNASQEQVFDVAALEVVRSVMDGYNGTIMAYGQTGAGKTHTMTGGHVGFADRGIVPRSISQMYNEAASRPESQITIRLSYVEIYNELMFDLLRGGSMEHQSGDMQIAEDAKGGISIRGASMVVAGTEEEALHEFFQGDTNRHVAEHALNKGSTRSHCVFTIHVESRSRVESSEKVISSKLHLVDLAGSERLKKTGTQGVTLTEATYINKSLTFLEQVVVALGDKGRDHIPYRQGKLTHMLKDSLGGNCKTTMIANIWPESKMLEETASTLRFAQRMMNVTNNATQNIQLEPTLLFKKYERQIKELKQELAMHNTLANRSHVNYEDYTPDEQRELEAKVKMYLEGDLQDLEIVSVRMAHEAFSCFRKLHNELQTELAQRPTLSAAAAGVPDEAQAGADAEPGDDGAPRAGEVGESEERGISVGIAPSGSRPAKEDRFEPVDAGDGALDGGAGGADRTAFQGRGRAAVAGEGEKPMDKSAAFAEWKAKPGQALEQEFDTIKAKLKEKKLEFKIAKGRVVALQGEVGKLKDKVQEQTQSRGGHEVGDVDYVDEEQFSIIKQLKDKKMECSAQAKIAKDLNMEMMYYESCLGKSKAKVVREFEEWYDKKYSGAARSSEAEAASGERYDPQEMFDLMEADKFVTQNPESLAYHKAMKNARRTQVMAKKAPQRVAIR